MRNPVKRKIEELQLSTHAVARIVEISQVSVWRHYHGMRRLSADAMEVYSGRLGISMSDMRSWNKYLKQEGVNNVQDSETNGERR